MTRTLRINTDHVQWREIDGEIVALDARASAYVAANRSATLLWNALVSGATLDELVGALSERYGVDRETATRDVEVFLGDLESRGILEAE